MSSQCGELRSANGWDQLERLGHPSKFQRVLSVCFVRGLLQRRRWTEAIQTLHNVWPSPGLVYIIQCVSKKDTTQPPPIISTIIVRFSNFWYKYCWVNMPLKGDLIYHLTCLLYVNRTLRNCKTPKITSSAIKEHLFENKQNYLYFICS